MLITVLNSSSTSFGIYTEKSVTPILIRWLYFKQMYTLSFVLRFDSGGVGGSGGSGSLVPPMHENVKIVR